MYAPMRVLVVEDDEDFRSSLVDLLAKGGFEVESAEDGPSALSKLDESDVMLADICLGGMDGIELCGIARSRRPDLEVIMMTGYDSVAKRCEATRYGARAFLAKPFQKVELMECLGEIRSERNDAAAFTRRSRDRRVRGES